MKGEIWCESDHSPFVRGHTVVTRKKEQENLLQHRPNSEPPTNTN